MAMISCPECGKEISDKAASCPNCGCPSSEWSEIKSFDENGNNSGESDLNEIIKNIVRRYSRNDKIKMIKDLREQTGLDLKEAKDAIEGYLDKGNLEIEQEDKEFHGIYRSTLFDGLQEVYCPRCGSENCSHYQEQKMVPGKTKTRYTVNLNPLKPFTLMNKKEKVVRKDEVVTESKFLCNKCGMIFS